MATAHMTDDEVTRNFAAVLEKIRGGAQVVVEQDHVPVALIRSPKRSGRPISECIASAQANASKITLDGGYAEDVAEGSEVIRSHGNRPRGTSARFERHHRG